jgi:hypothetical protein
MIDDKHQRAQNTTVSAIIVLATYPLWQNRVRIAINERQRQLGRPTTLDEDLAIYEGMPETPDFRRVRVSVYGNPYARIPLRRDLFNGPFDQRWGTEGQIMKRVYVGSELARFEEAFGES